MLVSSVEPIQDGVQWGVNPDSPDAKQPPHTRLSAMHGRMCGIEVLRIAVFMWRSGEDVGEWR